jgi:hypothetical protein
MSSTDAKSAQEALMRVLVAVVVALLWTRDLMAAKKAARATEGGKRRTGPVRWRITPERIAVWLHLADAIDTDVVTVESARQVARFLRVTDKERDGWRWPLTYSARAYRGRMRLISDALRHGDPTEVHQKLSAAAFTDALTRLGLAASQTQPAPAESGESEASPNRELLTPEHPRFAEAIASLPTPALPRRAAAASQPARKAAAVTARVGTDRDSVERTYRDSLATGAPLSTRDLAESTGVSQSTAARVIAAVRNTDSNTTEEVA